MSTNTERKQQSTTTEPAAKLAERLIEHDLDKNRLIPLIEGAKVSTDDHTDQANRFDAATWVPESSSEVKNYGVYAGEGLLLLDLDDYNDSSAPSAFDTLPKTFTTRTPHGGEHRYYRVAGGAADEIEAVLGSRNPRAEWGEVRAFNQYVVGPGSQLDGCSKDWCDNCDEDKKGWYLITNDRPIAEVDTETLLDVLREALEQNDGAAQETTEKTEDETTRSVNETTHEYPDDYDPIPDGYSTDEWIDERALPSDQTLRDLWNGRYAAAGYGDDRSKAEYALASKLTFWLGPHKDRVRRQMKRASTKKWKERADTSYRESVLTAVEEQTEFSSSQRGGAETEDDSPELRAQPLPSDPEVTRSEARQRTQSVLAEAFQRGTEVLVEALPTLGKSYGAVKTAHETGLPVTILTQRRDLYHKVREWCAEFGLDAYELPAMTEKCPTYTEDPETPFQRKVVDLYERGATPGEIHETLDNLPCQQEGDCPSLKAWDFESDDYDVLVGHYTQATVTPLVEDRVVVIDECPDGVFDITIDDTLGGSISGFLDRLKNEDDTLSKGIPQTYGGLHHTDPASECGEKLRAAINEAVERRDTWDAESRDTLAVDEHERIHRRAPEAAYAVLCGCSEFNSYERAVMDDGTVLLHDPEELAVHIRDPPSFDEARSVVCLDGTPTKQLWESTLGISLTHETVLSTPERRSYVAETQGWEFIQTTSEFVYNYTRRDNVNVEKSAALVEALRQHHETHPSLISTQACLRALSGEDVVDEDTSSKHYGSLKSSNEFADHDLGAVLGTRHFPREWVERETAFEAEEIEPEDDGLDKTYNSEYGDALLKHMREHEVLQAAMRFGREEDTNARVYIHTACVPDWVPREVHDVEIKTFRGTAREDVLDALSSTESPWTVEQVSEMPHVNVSERQVRNILGHLCEADLLERDTSQRPYRYRDTGIDRANAYGIMFGL